MCGCVRAAPRATGCGVSARLPPGRARRLSFSMPRRMPRNVSLSFMASGDRQLGQDGSRKTLQLPWSVVVSQAWPQGMFARLGAFMVAEVEGDVMALQPAHRLEPVQHRALDLGKLQPEPLGL